MIEQGKRGGHMGILGNVENGWFAQLAHGCEWASRGTLNFVSCGNQWGDHVYGTMHDAANAHVGAINQQAINDAMARGQTQIQALNTASAKMDGIADPKTFEQGGELLSAGTAVSGQTVSAVGTDMMNAIKSFMTPDYMPLVIGAGVLGTAFAAASVLGAPAKPAATPRKRRVLH